MAKCPHVSGQGKRKMRKGEKAKTTIIQRVRKRIHTTVSPETYEYIKNGALNAGKLLDMTIFELRTKTKANIVLICKNSSKEMPPAGIEPATTRSSVWRSPY